MIISGIVRDVVARQDVAAHDQEQQDADIRQLRSRLHQQLHVLPRQRLDTNRQRCLHD